MAKDKEPSEAGSAGEDEVAMTEGEIDLNLIQTFAASDPPSWTLGTDHNDESHRNRSSDEIEAED